MTLKELSEKAEMLSQETFELHTLIEKWSRYKADKVDVDIEIASSLLLDVSCILDKIQIILDKPF